MLSLADEIDSMKAPAFVRLAWLAYGASFLPVLGAVFPRDAEVLWPWVGAGAAVLVLMMLATFRMAHKALAIAQHYRPPAWLILIQNALMYVVAALFAYGLSGAIGAYRLLLLGPLLFMAVVGNRLMFTLSYLICLGCLAGITLDTTLPLDQMPALFIAYGGGFLAAGLFARELAQGAFKSMHHSEQFATLTSLAANADTIQTGLDAMMPVAASFLSASSINTYSIRNRLVSEEPTATWPDTGSKTSTEQNADLRIAAIDRKIVIRERWACAPVVTSDGVVLVLLVDGLTADIITRMTLEHSLEQMTVQLSVLLTRLNLIERLETLTETDGLTELPNRRALQKRIDHDLAVAARTRTPLSLVMIDIDHFKQYNDTYGHPEGDQLLKTVAQMIGSRLRTSDFVARYGGEEFCALLPATLAKDALVISSELQRRCRQLSSEHLAQRETTFSAGVAEWDGKESAADLLTRADQALYQAKKNGRDRTEISHQVEARRRITSPQKQPIPAPPLASFETAGADQQS